jgi:hypothetical protein
MQGMQPERAIITLLRSKLIERFKAAPNLRAFRHRLKNGTPDTGQPGGHSVNFIASRLGETLMSALI